MKKVLLVLTLSLFAASCSQNSVLQSSSSSTLTSSSSPSSIISTTTSSGTEKPELSLPISGALSRVTKKPFGIYITPQTSPVQPEKFTGYHTGDDFETTPSEQNIDVPIFAACNGKLLVKEYASGYGGVAVQACMVSNQPVTIIYGHLRLSSISPKVGQILTPGEQIAVLGTGYSSETDGERKHLHFGVHKGTSINILGYVQQQSELSGWLNPLPLLTP